MTETVPRRNAAHRASELYQRGFPRAAIDILEAELASQPDAGELWRLRALLLEREGRTAEAFDNIQRALVLVPLGPEGLIVLAAGYARQGARNSAAAVYLSLAADDDFPMELWEDLYNGLCSVGRLQSALSLCRRAARQRPDDDSIYFAAAHALARLGRPPELSINMLRKAIGLNSSEPRYRASLALQLMRIGRCEEAYRTYVEMSSEMVESLTCRCCLQKMLQLCIERGDADRAQWLARRLASAICDKRSAAADRPEGTK